MRPPEQRRRYHYYTRKSEVSGNWILRHHMRDPVTGTETDYPVGFFYEPYLALAKLVEDKLNETGGESWPHTHEA